MPPRNRYSERVRVAIDEPGESLTRQSMKAECDVNNIVRTYDRDGVLPHLSKAIPSYSVFTEDELVGSADFDYHQSLNIVLAAQHAFEGLPAELRKRFHNDPAYFIAFVDDPANRDEAVELGLVAPKPNPSVAEAEAAAGEAPVEEPTPTPAE